jgi:hypothetical protein
MTNSGNNDFERKIKSSLEGYEVPFVQADWNAMESKLNTLPKQRAALNIHLPKFKWNFSTNVFVAIIACAGIFFLVYKLSNTDTTKSEQMSPASPMLTPVLNTTSAQLPAAKPKNTKPAEHPAVVAADPSGSDTTLFFPVAAEVPAADNKPNLSVIPGPGPAKFSTPSEEKTVNHMEPVQTNLNAQDPSKVLFTDDMIDPKKGFVYPTKDKALDAQGAQTNVNVGWNDYVIYDPKKSDSLKSSHIIPVENKATDESSALKSKSDKKQKSSRKDKSTKADKAAATAVPETDTKEVNKEAESKAVPEPAKPDTTTTKKSHKANKNPKFTNDKSMLDPY